MLVDARGHPLKSMPTSGAAGHHPQALPLLAGQQAREVVADRGDDAGKTIASVKQRMQAVATSPPKKHRAVPRAGDAAAYKERRQGHPRLRAALSERRRRGRGGRAAARRRA